MSKRDGWNGNEASRTERQVEDWRPIRQLMMDFHPHEFEGCGWQCDRCGLHRNNKLAHPESPPQQPEKP